MSPPNESGVHPEVVPGWWLDHAMGEVAGCSLYAARRAAVARPGVPPEYATVLLAPGDDAARAALAVLGDPTPADALPLVLDGAPVALVLAPHIGLDLGPSGHRTATAPPSVAVAEPIVAAPVVSDAAPRGARRPVVRLVGATALVLLVAAGLTRARGDTSGERDEKAIRWDTETATVTVDQDGGTRRFALGAPGDQLVVGDWDGDRLRTPGLYRSSTGELWVFDRWAVEGEPAGARALERGATLGRAKVVRRDGRDTIVVEAVGG